MGFLLLIFLIRKLKLNRTLESLLALKVQLNKDFLKNNLERLVATVNDIMCMESDSENHYQKSREFVHFTNECLSLTPVVDGVSIQSFLTVMATLFTIEYEASFPQCSNI